jgi:hypothetical protein
MWMFQAYRVHEITIERRREADRHRLASELRRSNGPGPVRRAAARAFAGSSRSIASIARRLDAAAFDGADDWSARLADRRA